MTIYEKARDLGNLLLETEESGALLSAKDAFYDNEEAISLMENYQKMEDEIRTKMKDENFSQKDFEASKHDLAEYGKLLQENIVISRLVTCEEKFNQLLGDIVAIISSQVTGDFNDGGCAGGCGGCSGCH